MSQIFEALRVVRMAKEGAPKQTIADSMPRVIPGLEPAGLEAVPGSQPATKPAASAEPPTKSSRTIVSSWTGSGEKNQTERRTSKRTKLKLRAGLRRADTAKGQLPDVVTTENSSRGGFSFLSAGKNYYQGMPLLVTFPYSASDSITGAEQQGQVLRAEPLPNGKWRVAVGLGASHSSVHITRPGKERRQSRRAELSATVSYQESHHDMAVKARCSELSLGGCYVDTLNPLATGTRVHLQIERDGRTFECFARVCSSHSGSGMGLSFEEPAAEQVSTLMEWLCPTWGS